MIVIERFSKKYSDIFTENADLLQQRKLNPPKVINYALTYKNLVLLAIENKKPVGFIIGSSGQNRNSILTIFVKEECRNKKIGTLLVSSLLNQIREKKEILWTVRLRSIDYPIIGFFEHCGFNKITELNLYKKSNTDFDPIHTEIHNNISNTFSFELAENKHIYQLMEIEKSCFEPFWLRTKEEWKEIIEDENTVVFIVQDENLQKNKSIVGFSHNSIGKYNGYKEGRYIRIAVNPSYRRAGLATKLTEKAFDYFRRNDVKKVYLTTVKENAQLNEMYKKWGFEAFDSDFILGLTKPTP